MLKEFKAYYMENIEFFAMSFACLSNGDYRPYCER